MNAEIVNRIIFIVALLMLIMVLVGLIHSTLLRKKLKRRLYEAIKTLEKYPNITLKEGEREYSVYFICKSEKAYLNRSKETSGEWGAFCEVDKRTMRQFIACNSHVEIMNIPVEDLYFECFYKIVRVK
jgi:hypothetical protein